MRPGLIWVKVRRTPHEYMSSALPSNSDIGRRSRHFAFVPGPAFKPLWRQPMLMHLAVSEATMRSMTDDKVKRRLTVR